ncbi:MAG: C45 family peptidase [Candidatus Bathyarchaeota archaeon]|nr:C45 family peptidase [Candidatus Bathyarchaeota archaeon]
MSEKYNLIKKDFQHIILEGTAYEVGQQQAEILKRQNPEAAKWFASADIDPSKMGFDSFEELQAFYEEYCPGITDEILGFADGLGVKPDQLQLYSPPIYQPGNCSQLAVLSSVTNNKHVYVGRSYEYHHNENDFRLCTLRIKGKIKHIGFTEFLLGRDDGMNEHGLCVTFSGGGTFKKQPTKKGFNFFLVTRAILDNCKTVAESVEHLKKTPISGFWNFLVTDKNNSAALMQFFDGEYDVRQIDKNSNEQWLFSTNHYVLPSMVQYQKYAGDWILKNSKKRFELIDSTLSHAAPNISKEDIKNLLSKEIYDGLCGHYYTDYFGTLFSIIYDLTDLKADICFGAPTHNDWQKPFSLNDPVGVNHFSAILPDKSIKLDQLWDTS